MGFSEIRQKLMASIKGKQEEYKQAQQANEARDDFETVDKALRNKRRQARKYVDQDEKAQLEAYIRQRQAQEDRSWMNPFGMLDDQQINISRETTNVFANNRTLFGTDTNNEPNNNILAAPNPYRPTTTNTKTSHSRVRRTKK